MLDSANWSAPLVGDGSDNVEFGNLAASSQLVLIPDNFQLSQFDASTVTLHNISFTSYTTSYNFQSSNSDGESVASLRLTGRVDVSESAPVVIESSVNVALYGGSHTLCVASGGLIEVQGEISEIEGTASLKKTGAGTLVLSGSNTFSGGISLRGGTLLVGSDGALGSGELKLYDGVTLGVTSATCGITLENSLSLDCTGGTVTLDTTNGNLRLTGSISGAAGLLKTGSGTLELGGESYSQFSGGVTVEEGKLVLRSSSYQDGDIAGPVGSGMLRLEGNTTLAIAGCSEIDLHNDLSLSGGSGSVTFDSANGVLSLWGYISGDRPAIKVGSGTLELGYDGNDFNGGLTVQDGTLLVRASSVFEGSIISGPAGTGTLSFWGDTTLAIAGGDNITLGNAIDVSGEGNLFIDTAHGSLDLVGSISSESANSIVVLGSGQLGLSADNSGWNGRLIINSNPTVTVNDEHALNGGLIFDSASQGSVEFTRSATIGYLEGGYNHFNGEGYEGSHIQIDLGKTLTVDQHDNTEFAGIIEGDGSLKKDGSGALQLSGPNSYSGGTTVNGGTLIAGNNTAFGTGAVTINGGAIQVLPGFTLANTLVFNNSLSTPVVLSGNGTFGSHITADGHIVLSPGNSPGTLTFSAGLTLASGGAISFQIEDANGTAGTGYDLINISGGTFDLTAGAGQITFNLVSINSDNHLAALTNWDPSQYYSWMFASSSSAITGFNSNQFNLVLSDFTNNNGLAGGTFGVSMSGNNLYLNFTPVPEPSTWALLGTGVLAVAIIGRRKRKQA